MDEFRGHRRIGHSGGLPGYETHIARFVDDRLTVIILTNRLGANPWDLAGVVAGFYNPALKAPKVDAQGRSASALVLPLPALSYVPERGAVSGNPKGSSAARTGRSLSS